MSATMKLEPELCDTRHDDYLRRKVDLARQQRAAGLHFSNEEVEAEAVKRRAKLQRRADEAGQ
jgi:hypothetical protein